MNNYFAGGGKRANVALPLIASTVLLFTLISFLQVRMAGATTIFTVNTVSDTVDAVPGDNICDDGSGGCSLRAAIEEANFASSTGPVVINFNIPGQGVQTIQVASALPPIIRSNVVIDGATQTGSSCGDLWRGMSPVWNVQISGASLDAGLVLFGTSSTVKGLKIKGFNDGIILRGGGYHKIQCNAILSNTSSGVNVGSGRNVIGGYGGDGNLISGNFWDGILIEGGDQNYILGNFIGTDVLGSAPFSNDVGISIMGGSDNMIGSPSPGLGNLISGNSAAKNGLRGRDAVLEIFLAGTSGGTRIQGNYIGTDRTGLTAFYFGEPREAKEIVIQSNNNVIGGTVVGARNIVNPLHTGITVHETFSNNVILGNYIGFDKTGARVIAPALLPDADGIHDSGTGTIIGGEASGAGNVIAGFKNGAGIEKSHGSGATIYGNYIGTDVSGNNADHSLRNRFGIVIYDADNNTVSKNIIGNSYNPFFLAGTDILLAGDENTIQGNKIGIGSDGVTSLPSDVGIILFNNASGNSVGGPGVGMGNLIANHSLFGILLPGDFSFGPAGSGNKILGNSLYNNGASNIDLSLATSTLESLPKGDGVTLNDARDGDIGPNNLQNYPVITKAAAYPTRTAVAGYLESLPSARFRLEFFWSPSPTSNVREGKLYLGFKDITTAVNGRKNFSVSNLLPLPGSGVITATATGPDGSTSEFSGFFAPQP